MIILLLSLIGTDIYSKPKKKKSVKKSINYKSEILKDTLIYPGLQYKNILFGSRKQKISVNIIEVDLKNPDLQVSVMKAKNNICELDKIHDILRYNDSVNCTSTFCAVNASFWKAFRNNPIGACIVDGNVIEQNPYKEWSGIFFDINGEPYIDNFKLKGTVRLHDGKVLTLSSVNRRRDSSGYVLYNFYGGSVIPYLNNKSVNEMISKKYDELLNDSTFMVGDSTEGEFDFEEFEQSIVDRARSEHIESSLTKAVVEFIELPSINKKYKAIVNFLDTGTVNINQNQAVLSIGLGTPPDFIIYPGDTLEFLFETNIYKNIEFSSAATATPRLVRNGVAGHEAYHEGSKSRRFINGQLGRTAVGYSKDKDKFYLLTVDHTNRSLGKKGASLGELAQIMKQIGCYQAMNLDGGGSSVMLIDGKNVMAKHNPNASRKISVAIGVGNKSKN